MDKPEPVDRLVKAPKKGYHFRQSTKNKKRTECKNQSDSDSDDSDYCPDEDMLMDEDTSSDDSYEDEEEFNARKFQKFVQKIFPSKAGNERMKKLEKMDKLIEKKSTSPKKDNTLKQRITTVDKSKNPKKKSNSDIEFIEEEMRKEEIERLCEDLQDEEELDEEELSDMMRQNMKCNIVFTIERTTEEDETSEEESGDEEDKKEVKEDKKYIQFKKNQLVNVEYKDWDKQYPGNIVSVVNVCENPAYSLYDIQLNGNDWALQENIKGKYITVVSEKDSGDVEILDELKELVKCRNTEGKVAMVEKLSKMSEAHERKQEKAKKKMEVMQKFKNVQTLRKLLKPPNMKNDMKYFKNMDFAKQKQIIKKMKEVNKLCVVEKPYRLQLLESDMPACYQAAALKKINVLNHMDPSSGEYYKIKQWVDAFMSIPFGKTEKLPLTIDDGIDLCSMFMENAKKVLDECVYGLDDAKMQILQLVGQWLSNPDSIGTAIAIKGPPGTGKTTLIKEGISKILQRPFAFLALGGATDSSFLEGHGYTYEGSHWGKIVNILMKSKCMNPVIYFDELDKISDTPKGEEITGILTHLTDTTQNSCFHDKYFANMDFDLSKALFIFSYNDESKINPVLKDRMYRIHTGGYDSKQKIIIAKKYLIPKIVKNVNFKVDDINITDESIGKIIDDYTYKEQGVRNLKRCLEIIYTKLNLYRLMKPDSTLFEKKNTIKVTFPFTVTPEVVTKLIKKDATNNIPFNMYI